MNSVIQDKAYQIIQQANIPLEPPIDVMALADSVGVNVYLGKFKNPTHSGFITTNPELVRGFIPGRKATIVVNDDHPLTRQRFTIAHELGHLTLGHLEKTDQKNRAEFLPYNPDEERDANYFAAEVLMPEIPFKSAMVRQNGNLVSIAITFGVSVEAASIRTSKLGILDWANFSDVVVD